MYSMKNLQVKQVVINSELQDEYKDFRVKIIIDQEIENETPKS